MQMWWARRATPVLLLALLGGCQPSPTQQAPTSPKPPRESSASDAPAAPATPVTLEHVKSTYVAQSVTVSPMWVAKQAGIFDKYGIETEPFFMQGSPTGIAALLAGEVDIGLIGADGNVSAQLNGADVVLLGSISNKFTLNVYSDPSIRRPEDLRGKRVAIGRRGDTTDSAARFAARYWGLNPDTDFQLIQAGDVPTAFTALVSGSVDAAVISPPITIQARNQGFYQLADLNALPVEFPGASISTTRSFVKDRPEAAARFVTALVEAIHFMKNNKERSLVILASYLRNQDPEVLEEAYETFVTTVRPVPYTTPESIKNLLEVLSAANPAAAGRNPEQFVDSSILRRLEDSGFVRRLYGQ